jgi:hypothetical protein
VVLHIETYSLCLSLLQAYFAYFIWDIIRILDAKNRSQEFNLAPPEDFQKSKVQQDVEKKLLALQELQQLSWNSSVDEQKAKECLGVLRGRLVDSAEMV